jgi:hypothetical protein
MADTASSYLSRTLSASNRKTWTFSTWFKLPDNPVGTKVIWANSYADDNANYAFISIETNMQMIVESANGSNSAMTIATTRKFHDPTSWYHMVVRADTTQSTAANRLRIYINGGDAETSFTTNNVVGQNIDMGWNMNLEHRIGNFKGLNRNFNGLLAHTQFCDGNSYGPSSFGEFDSTTNEWKAKLTPNVTYGTNGFFLKWENASNFGLDSSGESNNFTTSGTFRQDTDTPSNNFITLDKNQAFFGSIVDGSELVDHGGTAWLGTNANATGANCTMMMSDGKWYAEFKPESDRTTADSITISIYKNGTHASRRWKNSGGAAAIVGKETGSNGCEGITYQPMTSTPNIIDDGGGGTVNYGVQASANDIIMMAFDLTSATSKIWWGKNGTWFNAPSTSNAGNPATGANAGLSFAKGDEFWGINVTSASNQANNANKYMYCNFGRGCFGTTAVSSGNADDNGYGIFEYDVPAGFYAICTKNIKEHG